MKPLSIEQFKGRDTVKKNRGLAENAAFYSKVKSFEGKLSSSHYVVKFPIRGVENYFTLGRKIQVDNHSYVITNPGAELDAYVKSEQDVIGVCVGFTKDFLTGLATVVGQRLDLSLDNPFINTYSELDFFTKKNRIQEDSFGRTLNSIKQHVIHGSIADVYEEEQFYVTFGEQLVKNELDIHSKISNLPHSKLSTREEIYRRIDIMDQYIHDNYTEEITLEQLSRIAFLSKYHAVRCYQKVEGISPYKKILALRIQKASVLLSQGYSVTAVSDMCGFADYRAFSKSFKKHQGVIPSQYARRSAS